MQLKKHASLPLRLAILSIIYAANHTTAYAQSHWNCRQIDQQWECDSAIANLSVNNLSALSNSLPLSTQASNAKDPIEVIEPTSNPLTTKSRSPNKNQQLPAAEKTTPLRKNKQSLATNAKQALEQSEKTAPVTTPAPTDEIPASLPTTPIASTAEKQPKSVPTKQSNENYKALDWYPYTASSSVTGVCKGRYISPQIGDITSSRGIPSLQTVFVSADETNSELGKSATLQGNVDIQQGSRSLNSPLAKLDQESGAFTLEQGVVYRQTGLLISGEKAEGNINKEETRLINAKYVLHEKNIRGEAGAVIRKTQDKLNIEEGTITFCPPGDESWKISASNINLDTSTGFGRAKNAKLSVFGKSVLYFPVFYFPIDDRRHSGFLYPNLKFSSGESQLSVPYYFNIATDMDDTLTATLYSKSGLLLENEFRYLDEFSNNRLSTGFLKSNKYNEHNRWVVGANHQGQYNRFNTVIDYTEVSDDDYFSDLDTTLNVDEGLNDHLNQTAKVTYNADNWQSSLLVQKYQTIDATKTKPYQRLPEFRVSGSPTEGIEELDFNYRAVFTRFDRDQTGLTGSDRTIGERLIFNPSISTEFRDTWGYIRPAAKLWHASYNLSDQPTANSSRQSVTVPVLELDSGLYFDRDFSFQNKAYTQTLEPRLYALYAPHVDQSALPDFDTSELTFTYNSLFRDNRFSGDDRFGDAKQISLGVTSRAISDQGREIISASIGHAFYFNDRKVRVNPSDSPLKDDTSDFATSLVWRPNTRVRALFDAAFDAGTLNNSEMTLDLKYEEDPNHVIGVRHRFTRGVRKQTTFSYLWPIANNWSSLGLLQYDWQSNNSLDFATGLEYQSCCWKTRLVFRNELTTSNKRDNSLALQFSFKGLGGLGKSPTKELRDKIKGYQKREYYNANN